MYDMFKVRFFDVFRRYRKAAPGCNGLKYSVQACDVIIFHVQSKSTKKLKSIWLCFIINVDDFSLYYFK